MTERRYDDDEVAAIFKQATEAQQKAVRQLPAGEGMTLAELEQIGREAGIAPELVAQAARGLDRAGQPTGRRFLGLPLGVGRIVELDRKLTEEEWERLVADLRVTFDARGTVRQEGSLRQWTNGNLHVYLEPGERGHRVRLRTMKGNALGYMMAGLGVIGIGAVTSLGAMFAPGVDLGNLLGFGVIGAGLFAAGAAQLPAWARRRREQMDEIARRLPTSSD